MVYIKFFFNNGPNSENKITNLIETQKGTIHIATHPFVASHINTGWFFSSIRHKWERKFKRTLTITADDRLHLLQYSVVK